MVGVKGSGKQRWLIVLVLAAGITSALTVLLALAGPARSIPRGLGYPLSEDEDSRWSGSADISVSWDGDKVAVVWSEAYSDTVPTRMGSVKLRWASESGESGWSSHVSIFSGSDQACATWASVAVTGTTAHVAYVVKRPCEDGTEQSVHYRPYELGGALGVSSTVASRTLVAAEPGFGKVDVAVDAEGDPHVAYIFYPSEGIDLGTVYYRKLSDGSPGPEEPVSGSNARNPAIAWSDEYVHAVWEDFEEGDPQILYKRRDAFGWDLLTEENLTNSYGSDTRPPRNPDVAAYRSRVVVTWDWEWTELSDPNQFALAYARYLDGTGWDFPEPAPGRRVVAREVGTEVDLSDTWAAPDPESAYLSTSTIVLPSPFQFLQPTVALDGEGMPSVVWHANLGPVGDQDQWDYSIMAIRAQSMTVSGTTWLTPTILNHSTPIEHSGSPVVALAPITSPNLHVAYLNNEEQAWTYGNWDTYYIGVAPGEDGELPSRIFLPTVMRNYSTLTLLDHMMAIDLPLDHSGGADRWHE